jgi:ornithine carbamoyltransferase
VSKIDLQDMTPGELDELIAQAAATKRKKEHGAKAGRVRRTAADRAAIRAAAKAQRESTVFAKGATSTGANRVRSKTIDGYVVFASPMQGTHVSADLIRKALQGAKGG